MKKRRIIILTVFLAVVVGFFLFACVFDLSVGPLKNKSSDLIIKISNSQKEQSFPFKPGEVILYDVKTHFFKIGNASLEFEGISEYNDLNSGLIVLNVNVANLKDKEEIFFSPHNFNPYYVIRDVRFFGRHEKIFEDYTKAKNSVVIKKTLPSYSEEIIDSRSSLDHAIAIFYYYRQLGELSIGREVSLNLPLEKLRLIVRGIEEVTVPAGTFKAYYIESIPAKFKIWLSADEKKIPLKIEGAIKLIPAALLMREYRP